MAPERKNEFLDDSDSEDEQQGGYDSDDDLRKGGRSTKRRRLDQSADEGSDLEDQGSDGQEETENGPNDDGIGGEDDDENDQLDEKKPKKAKRLRSESEIAGISRPLTKKNLVASEKAIKKSGVVYLSRVPPFMKPTKLRSLLEPYGAINRIFLAPEDPAAHTRRVRAGGNKKRSYTEGWVEFIRKKDAKAACELLNAHTIGGKKGNYYHDDIWNLLYLNGFKWHNLTEQIAAENAERTSRMRAEISKTTKENKDFVKNVERAKMLDGMQNKAKKRKVADEGESDIRGDNGDDGKKEVKNNVRSFRQIQRAKKATDADEQPEHVSRVLSKIF